MNKIKKLSPLEAQKIAAGEVVERPANIVKELIENSIDAGATSITLYIQEGGKNLIRIIDNGCGMSGDDAHLCFEHHATSKIETVDDLHSINSFGFRGEALASIAAVSRVKLITTNASDKPATSIAMEGGKQIACIETAHALGTELIIEDVFFNVPARKKFLKSTQTEYRAIAQVFQAFCFDYPDISFTLYADNNLTYQCPATHDLKKRIAQLWQPHEATQMISMVTHIEKKIAIEGCISSHQLLRYDKNHLFIFVNKRLVKNQHLIKAFLKGYAHSLPEGRYPSGIITITCPQEELDVNVHPRKQEVQFLHPRIVEQAVTQAVESTLKNNVSAIIKQTYNSPITRSTYNYAASSFFNPTSTAPQIFTNHEPTKIFIKEKSNNFTASSTLDTSSILSKEQKDVDYSNVETPLCLEKNIAQVKISKEELPYHIIGQLHKTYIMAESIEGLVLIDQHAAHERILYEQFKHKFGDIAPVQLLFPEALTLNNQEANIIERNQELFVKHGIILDALGSTTFTVRALPVFLKDCRIIELIQKIIALIIEEEKEGLITQGIHEKVHAQMACKAAIKAGDTLSIAQMTSLLHDLETCENRQTCPHGRPTIWSIPLSEIERKFRRRL